ncbi:MAG: hypothetical protein QM756_37515 [Polyangiaceae bacterium]
MRTVKGMVQVAGTTYRIVRLAAGHYEAVRILDDARVGEFRSIPEVSVTPKLVDVAVMTDIARAALQGAKLSWIGRVDL